LNVNNKGKRMKDINDLRDLCAGLDACGPAVRHLETCKTIEEAMDHPQAPEWALWLRTRAMDHPDLFSDEELRILERLACGNADMAERLRRTVPGVPDDIQRLAELKACEDPEQAYHLRHLCADLSATARREAELAACKDRQWASELRLNVDGLHPDTIAKLKELGIA